MNTVARSPDSCTFRQIDDRHGQRRWACRLVARVVGEKWGIHCHVDQTACDACCQHALPSGGRLNPVVASLVYSSAEHARRRFSPNSLEQVDIHHARQYALRWVATIDKDRRFALRSDENTTVRFVNEPPAATWGAKSPANGKGRNQRLRIGLVGYDSGSGLGHQNRDIAKYLGVDRWLVAGHRNTWATEPPCRIDVIARELSPIELEAWLDGLDVALFVESPVFGDLPRVARQLGVRIVCVPNWEWLHPGLEWLVDVDLMLCPTRFAATLLSDWKQRFGFDWEIAYTPWPVDPKQFPYRRRRVCRRFVYVNGSGGAFAACLDGSGARFRRKGLDVLLAAATLAPEIPLVVYARPQEMPPYPPNVELRPPPAENRLLYCDGDVCVQPSRWEGLGLPLLECQAAGMPLITTDAPPMNEHQPLAVIPAKLEAAHLTPELCIPAARVQPDDFAAVLRSVLGRRISADSRRARRFIKRHHSWPVAGPQILRQIRQMATQRK